MEIVTKIIIFVIFVPLGTYFIAKSEPMVKLFGKNSWAERVIPGGSYGMWKLIGIILVILGIMFLFGGIDWLIYPK